MIAVALVGWLLALAMGLLFLLRLGPRYFFRSLRWRLTAPLGHRNTAIIGGLHSGNMAGFWMASCECGFAERAISEGGAEGALRGHLRKARPWAHYAGSEPCEGATQHIALDQELAQRWIDIEDQDAGADATAEVVRATF